MPNTMIYHVSSLPAMIYHCPIQLGNNNPRRSQKCLLGRKPGLCCPSGHPKLFKQFFKMCYQVTLPKTFLNQELRLGYWNEV